MRLRDIKPNMVLTVKPFTEESFYAVEEKYGSNCGFANMLLDLIGTDVTVDGVDGMDGKDVRVIDNTGDIAYLPAALLEPSDSKVIVPVIRINWLIVREEDGKLKMGSAFAFHGTADEVSKEAIAASTEDGERWVWFERRGSVTVGKTVFGD